MNESDEIFPGGIVTFEDGRLTYVGASSDFASQPSDQVVEASGCVVMPGLVNAHTHSPMTFQRGLIEDLSPPDWFARTYALEAAISDEQLYWAALLGSYEMLRHGVTCVADRYSHMDVVGEAVDRSGLRAVLGPSLYDIGRSTSLEGAIALVKRWGTSPERRITCGLAPVGPDTSSTELLGQIRSAATQLGARIFIHLAQSRQELEVVRARGFEGPVHYLHALGFLGPDVVAAHCIYISDIESDLLAESGVKVAHCPSSNAKIEARVAPIGGLLARGVDVGLGTDCAPANNIMDLFQEMKVAALVNKIAAGDPVAFPVQKVLRMATRDAARALGLDLQVGSLEEGKRADIITIDWTGLHLQPPNDTYAHLVYSARGSDVRDVFIDGRPLLRDGAFLNADVEEARQHARQWRVPGL